MIRKIIPYILILVIITGFFSPLFGGVAQVHADQYSYFCGTPNEKAAFDSNGNPLTQATCVSPNSWYEFDLETNVITLLTTTPATATTPATTTAQVVPSGALPPTPPTPTGDTLQDAISGGCGLGINESIVPGCLVYGAYMLFFQLPAFILTISANFFDTMLELTVSSKLYNNSFLPSAWAIVRDFSNMFFILILLYIAVKVILDIGHDSKKMIMLVILMALLINFSMFFTEVIIDSSNVLALVFYNKINITTSRPYDDPLANTGITGKDIGGQIAESFNPAATMNPSLVEPTAADPLKCAGTPANPQTGTPAIAPDPSYCQDSPGASDSFFLAIIFTSCLIFLFAAYAFFIAAISFLGRLVELWILIIFSPFAFVSSTVPLLEKIDNIGWSSWLNRLLKTAFMAPVFMIFMWIIVSMVGTNGNNILTTLENKNDNNFIAQLLIIVIPAAIDIILLMKAVEFAKKGGGKIGEVITKGIQAAGGLALGAATGGAAILGTATLGRAGAAAANSEWAKRREAEGRVGSTISRNIFKAAGSGSFDIRNTGIGKTVAKTTGLNLGEARQGGFEQRRKEQVERRQKRAKELEVGEDEGLKQNLNAMEEDLQSLLRTNSHELEQIDKQIVAARENARDLESAATADPTNTYKQAAADTAATELANWKQQKFDIRNAQGNYAKQTINGRSIRELEVNAIPNAHHAIETENRNRKWAYSTSMRTGWEQTKQWAFTGGQYSPAGAREASHRIRMEQKLDSGEKGGH